VFLLILAKIFLNGLYLKGQSLSFRLPDLALAEDGVDPMRALGAHPLELRKREEALKAREDRLNQKEAELKPLQEEIEARMAELNELQARLTAYAKGLAEKEKAMEDAKMAHLVALYTAMDPSKAAAIMDKLHLESVVLILRHMKGKAAGKILANLDPEKAATVSEALGQSH
jgi:flagellar motility protein MotE (MotC chaperone)